ncbi:MAG TPA: PEP-utilizing enzyme [Thermomicrobiales bacterium]|nr:PEP-utilizing enzyme [Thermomicrobiales bacterium]
MASTNATTAPATVPTPPNFPVTWEQPGDADLTWLTDRLHFPDPITPLDDWLNGKIWQGGERSAARFGYPFVYHWRRINTYAYYAITLAPGEPEELAAREHRANERMQEALGHLMESWAGEYVPEIKRHLAVWAGFDVGVATLPDLLAHLEDMEERQLALWELHDLAFLPANTVMSMFDDLYRDLFGEDQVFAGYRLLQGFDNATLAAARGLWRLSRRALAEPSVRRVLEEQPGPDALDLLGATTEGRDFLGALRDYLAEYGQYSETWVLTAPSWVEDPSTPLAHLRAYLARPEYDPEAELASLAAEREAAVARAREQLRGHPAPVRERFEALLRAAQAGVIILEDHNFWIDRPCIHYARQLFLAIGRHLVARGALARPDDIFCLTPDEVRQTATAPGRVDRRATVAGRQAEMAYFRTITPPLVLGAPPPEAPADDPVLRGVDKFFGPAPDGPAEPGVVRGSAGSPGKARGVARVIRSLAEAERLRPGDILVTGTTSAAWTPLFAIAAAIVTDTGGVLSHCAVVAREYRLPAVVGTGAATTALRDGQVVEVDGDAGVVRVVGS